MQTERFEASDDDFVMNFTADKVKCPYAQSIQEGFIESGLFDDFGAKFLHVSRLGEYRIKYSKK
jgi:hypothetical protein